MFLTIYLDQDGKMHYLKGQTLKNHFSQGIVHILRQQPLMGGGGGGGEGGTRLF